MFPRHWTPRYFWDLFNLRLNERLHPRDPWFTRDSIVFLKRFLLPNFRGLEWGSGRSTGWLAERTTSLVSIETDAIWYKKTKKELIQHKIHDKVNTNN